MSNEFVARKGLVIKDVLSGITENHVLVQDVDGLVKYRTSLELDYLKSNYIYLNTGLTASAITFEAGKMFYDESNKTVSVMIDGDVTLQLGQEDLVLVYANENILNGQLVYVTGSNGLLPMVSLAIANNDIKSVVLGMATQNIPIGTIGLINSRGLVHDLSITGATIGQILYLSDTVAGSYTTSASGISYSSRVNNIGYVIATGLTNAIVYVDITNENITYSLTNYERNILTGNVASTSAYSFNGLYATTGTTVFGISPIEGWIVKNTYSYATSPVVTHIVYSGATGVTLINLSAATATYVLIDENSVIQQITTDPTPQQRREMIYLGKVVHPDKATILTINNLVDFEVSPMSAIRDLWTPIKLINDGIAPYPDGANLQFNMTGGDLWGNGINWVANQLSPDKVTLAGKTPVTFQYKTQTGGTYGNTTFIDPTMYDLNGTLTAVPSTAGGIKSTVQRIYLFPTGVVRIQYGQQYYDNLTAAIGGISTQSFVVYENNRTTGILVGLLAIAQHTTNLNTTADAVFISVSKFGELMGGSPGGISTTNLQQAYDNSINPEILTNSTLGALTIKNGIADDSNNVFEVQSYGDGNVFSINGSGRTITTTLTITGITSLTGLTRFVFVDSSGNTYYLNDSPVQNDFLIWSGGTWVSSAGIIGVPTDGTYTDGFFDTWVDSTTIANAVDDINEVLKKLAPSKPPELNTKTILLSSSYASATLNKASDGVAVSYLLVSDSNTTDVQLSDMTTVSTGGGFNKYVGANLTGFIDNVSVGSINYPNGNMNTGTTNNNKLTAIEYDYWGGVAGKSDFWPAVVARINDVFSGLSYGVHTSKLSWSGTTEYETTNLLTIYYDNPVTPSGNTLNLSAQTYVTRWISGVPTFSTGDLLAVNFGFTGLVSQVYRPNPISATSSYASTVSNTLSGIQTSGTTISGILNPVVQTSKYIEDITVSVTATNAKGTATSYNNMTIATSQAGKTMRVDTVSNESTRKLSGGIAGNFPVTYGGVFASGSTLIAGDYLYELQMLNGVYRRITGNYTTNFPIAGPNYSSDSNTDYRWVMFSYSITTKSSITVTVAGTNFTTVAGTQVTDNMKIFVKVEGSTGWLDANGPYPGVGTPIADGDLAMVTASSTATTTTLVKYVTFGAGNYSGTLYVRLGMASGSNDTLTSITVV